MNDFVLHTLFNIHSFAYWYHSVPKTRTLKEEEDVVISFGGKLRTQLSIQSGP